LVGHRFDLKHIYRLVLNSKTYQLSSEPLPLNAKDAAHFSHYQTRRLTAEQAIDSLVQITGFPERFLDYRSLYPAPDTRLPMNVKAAQVSDASVDSSHAAMFGRPDRNTGMEGERAADINRQHVQFFMSYEVGYAIGAGPRIQRLRDAKKSEAEVVEEIFLLVLSRFPTEAERQSVAEYFKKNPGEAFNDAVWALLNTDEFLFNH
jgi:hypothetical protein